MATLVHSTFCLTISVAHSAFSLTWTTLHLLSTLYLLKSFFLYAPLLKPFFLLSDLKPRVAFSWNMLIFVSCEVTHEFCCRAAELIYVKHFCAPFSLLQSLMDKACHFPKLVHTGNLILTSNHRVFYNLKDIEYDFKALCIMSVKNWSTWLVGLETLYLRHVWCCWHHWNITKLLPIRLLKETDIICIVIHSLYFSWHFLLNTWVCALCKCFYVVQRGSTWPVNSLHYTETLFWDLKRVVRHS